MPSVPPAIEVLTLPQLDLEVPDRARPLPHDVGTKVVEAARERARILQRREEPPADMVAPDVGDRERLVAFERAEPLHDLLRARRRIARGGDELDGGVPVG